MGLDNEGDNDSTTPDDILNQLKHRIDDTSNSDIRTIRDTIYDDIMCEILNSY